MNQKQYGGLMLRNGNNMVDDFSPIGRMLSNPLSLTLLSSSSLKGFIYTLNVSKDVSEYVDLNPQTGVFDIPVTSYILKVVIISDSANEKITERYDTHGNGTFEKSTECRDSLIYESKIQMAAWKRSVEYGNPMVCPSIANLTIFTDNGNSKEFITRHMAIQSHNLQDEYNISLEYLLYLLNKPDSNYRIGVLTMPNIANSITYKSYMFNDRYIDKTIVSIQLITQIIRLFLQSIVIHFDLHPENALVILETRQVVIIDFGTASDISNGIDDGLINAAYKSEYFEKLKEFKTIISGSEPDYSYSKKIETIREIIQYILGIEEQQCYYNMQRLFNTVLKNYSALASIYNLVKERITPRNPRLTLNVAGLLFSNPGEIDTDGPAGVQLVKECSPEQKDAAAESEYYYSFETIAERVAKRNRQIKEAINRRKTLRNNVTRLSKPGPFSRGGKRAKSKKTQKKRKTCKRTKKHNKKRTKRNRK